MSNHSHARRNLLRGIVATGCALWLQRGFAVDSSTDKLSKAQASYQSGPKGDQACAGCMHFLSDSSTCRLVEGNISPQGWCQLWAKQQAR